MPPFYSPKQPSYTYHRGRECRCPRRTVFGSRPNRLPPALKKSYLPSPGEDVVGNTFCKLLAFGLRVDTVESRFIGGINDVSSFHQGTEQVDDITVRVRGPTATRCSLYPLPLLFQRIYLCYCNTHIRYRGRSGSTRRVNNVCILLFQAFPRQKY